MIFTEVNLPKNNLIIENYTHHYFFQKITIDNFGYGTDFFIFSSKYAGFATINEWVFNDHYPEGAFKFKNSPFSVKSFKSDWISTRLGLVGYLIKGDNKFLLSNAKLIEAVIQNNKWLDDILLSFKEFNKSEEFESEKTKYNSLDQIDPDILILNMLFLQKHIKDFDCDKFLELYNLAPNPLSKEPDLNQ